MISLQISCFLIYFVYFCALLGQVWCQIRFPPGETPRHSGVCPKNFRCISTSNCSPRLLRSIVGPPRKCGDRRSRKSRICCPQRYQSVTATEGKPKGPRTPRPPKVSTEKPINPNPGDCGRSFGKPVREGYILGGVDAVQGAWPWMVAIRMKNRRGDYTPQCTGFLIDKVHVLSAAHCFDRKHPSLYSTTIGNVDLTKGATYHVKRIAIHEGYKKGQFYNDVALLTLSEEVNIPNFSPICLPEAFSSRNLTGRGTTVVGWGSTSLSSGMSKTLKQLSAMPVVSNYVCNEAYMRQPKIVQQFPHGINHGMMCAGFMNEPEKDSCGGDSGGPLMYQEKDRWYAVGIVSFGYLCGRPDYPGGYTRVSEYVDWINQHKS